MEKEAAKRNNASVPPFFQELIQLGCLTASQTEATRDGFWAVTKSLADILTVQGITTFPNAQGQMRECDKFFDDWYLYAIPQNTDYVYSLFKMREQEHDLSQGLCADGDTPGVTISFISFDVKIMAACIADPSFVNRKALNEEINRVVSQRKQTHHPALKTYFIRPEAEGPYLIAELFVQKIASLAQNGSLPVPVHYAALCKKSRSSKKDRIMQFLIQNNNAAGRTVCDHEKIFIQDPGNLSVYEKNAILATHTANLSFHSFAAEVRYHACFLSPYARIPIPFAGKSIYDSAIRADMTIDDTEFEGPAPFYRLDSKWVTEQQAHHPQY